jgi:hypothetical protein
LTGLYLPGGKCYTPVGNVELVSREYGGKGDQHRDRSLRGFEGNGLP